MSRSLLNSFAEPARHQLVWLVLVFVLAALGKLSLEGGASLLVTLAIFLTAGIAFFNPWLGLLALFPLSFTINSTPETIGFRELSFATLCVTLMVGTVVQIARNGMLRHELRKWGALIVIVVAYLALNFFVGRANAIPVQDWVRGLAPFVFLLVFWPVFVLLQSRADGIKWLGLSLVVMALLFVSQVLVVYFAEGLYNPFYYLLINGEYVPTDPPADPSEMGDKLGPYYFRVTTMLAQSTDALLPVTFSVAYVVSVLAPSQRVRRIAFLLTCLASTSILATYTRSMLMCALLSVSIFGLSLLVFQPSKFLLALKKGIFVIVVSIAIVFAINLDAVWYNRSLELYYSLGINIFVDQLLAQFNGIIEVVSEWLFWLFHVVLEFFNISQSGLFEISTPAEAEENIDYAIFAADVNILTRLEEYRIALDVFYGQPITGAGLGIRHEMVFETSTGEKLIQQVGYIHNWVFYFLMVGGLIGTALYSALLILPPLMFGISIWLARKMPDREKFSQMVLIFNVVWVGLLTMGLYSLFFAVFRLISYNLLMAAGLGICAYTIATLRKRAS